MEYIKRILDIANENKGYVTSKIIREIGISTKYLTILKNKGEIYQVARGIYVLPTIIDDFMFTLQLLYPKIVFSRTTAVQLQGLSTCRNENIQINVPSSWRPPNIPGVFFHRLVDWKYELGISCVKDNFGNVVKTYDKERCICDLFIYDYFDTEQRQIIVHKYRNESIDFDKLYEYANLLGILNIVKNVFELL